MKPIRKYRYLGDRLTDPALKGQLCLAVLNKMEKCIRGRNGSMLVFFPGQKKNVVVIAKRLRKVLS